MWRLPEKFFLAVCLASIALSAHLAMAQVIEAAPKLVTATYKVYKAGIWIGTIDERFTRDGEHYKIVSATETAGPLRLFLRDTLTVTSEGTIGAGGLKPDNYQFARHNDRKKNISAAFDWDVHQIASRHNDESETFKLPEGTQDRISAMYQFMFNIPRATEVNVWMTQGKQAEQYRYRKVGEPLLTLNKESFATVYCAREAKQGEAKVHLWLAKEKYFLPIKIVFEDANGGSLEQVLVALHTEQCGAAILIA